MGRRRRESSFDSGVGTGCGLVLGILLAVAVIGGVGLLLMIFCCGGLVALPAAGKVRDAAATVRQGPAAPATTNPNP